MKLQLLLVIFRVTLVILVILGARLEGSAHMLGTWVFLLPKPSGEGHRWWSVCVPGASRREEEQFVSWRAMVGAGGELAQGRGQGWGQVSGVQVPRRGTAVCNQLFDFE